MIAAWMLYSIAVGVLIGAAALAADRFCRTLRLATRWVWIGGMLAALGMSAFALVRMLAPQAESPLQIEALTIEDAASGTSVTSSTSTARRLLADAGNAMRNAADSVYGAVARRAADGTSLAVIWAAASAVLFLILAATLMRLRRSRRDWREHHIDSVRVLVSRDAGPALVGLLRPAIVVPAWLLRETPERQRLIVRHEEEHLRARDHVVLAAACVIVCLMPWNAPLWWLLLRTRLAVELDCDARVLGAGAPARSYGALLLEIAARTHALPFSAPALADSTTHLERRLIAMTENHSRPRTSRATTAALSALLLVVAACATELPTAAAIDDMNVVEARREAEVAGLLTPLTIERAPLYIVDGVIVSSEVANGLAPEEIRSIEVLKTDAARRVYGEESVSGVIRVRTRAEGELREKRLLGEPVSVEGRALERSGEVRATLREREAAGIIGGSERAAEEVRVTALRKRSTERPLMIIDGVIVKDSDSAVPGELVRELPIESIEIVKGRAAQTLYDDPRAVNGVILITTKKRGSK